jgi:inositol hexakisphosphate/diphosphoinositol-pentakisphosphate kinase
LNKPFVEKPRNSEDHDIRIYYPLKEGGGTKYLFRKIKNISSRFDKNKNGVRSEGSYIYEKFLQTDGFDIKVYAIGTNYFHSEARKSPMVDGKVQRRKDGRECRYQVNLTPEEKIICRKIVMIFDQQVCGFDIIRTNNTSYVCDVNGWSFVKGNKKYTQDCAFLLRSIIYEKFKPFFFDNLKVERKLLDDSQNSKMHFRPKPCQIKVKEELRSVIGIFRHEDRTPKQKMKMMTEEAGFLEYFTASAQKQKEIRLKSAKCLKEFLKMVKETLIHTLKKLKDFHKPPSSFDEESGKHLLKKKSLSPDTFSLSQNNKDFEDLKEVYERMNQIVAVLEINGHFEGINRKIQLRPKKFHFDQEKNLYYVKKVLFILKWGGEITHSGIKQAEKYGIIFRNNCYPREKDGLLRLHSTYRHDLKVYSADEGRCQITAGAFVKGLLNIEEDITPIISSFVNCDEKAISLLDYKKKIAEHSWDHYIQKSSPIIETVFSLNTPLKESISSFVDEYCLKWACKIEDPLSDLIKVYDYLTIICNSVQKNYNLNVKYYIKPSDIIRQENDIICGSENLILFTKRWSKLYSDFYNKKTEKFNFSKITEINDALNYDILHNMRILEQLKFDYKPFKLVLKRISDFYIQFEYGSTNKKKVELAHDIVSPLIKKIISDLTWWQNEKEKLDNNTLNSEIDYYLHRGLKSDNLESDIKSCWRHVRTRLYFTCASHIYSLFFLLIFDKDSKIFKNKEI